VLILKNLWSHKIRQNTVKRGVLVDVENKGVAKFEVPKTKNANWKLALRDRRRTVTCNTLYHNAIFCQAKSIQNKAT
jgi:hypothetical protein